MTTPPIETYVRVGDLVAEKYRVDHVLGQGGMGFVVAATHVQLDQRVALKFLLPAIVGNQEVVERFLREARAAVKIHSEHVARVFDVGTHDGVPFMVMELLEGNDLGEVIASRGRLPVREAAGYLLEACDAVAEAHSLGIVHRDLKPANLFLAHRPSGKPIVKVLDFGISKLPATDKERVLTNATAIMGSPSYMSPEQLVASATVDARSDIWSLGVVFYEMLSASLPFRAESMPELVGLILQQTFMPLVDAPADARVVLDRCLQKDREQRYATVADLARALVPLASPRHAALVERIEGVLGLSGPTSSVRPPVQGAASAAQQTLAPTTSAPRKSTSLQWVAIASGLLAFGGVAGALVWRQAHRQPPSAPAVAAHETAPVLTNAQMAAPPPVMPDPTTSVTATPTSSNASASTPPESAPSAVAHVAHGKHAHASAVASASSAPACKTVSSFDSDGQKHFKLVCP